MSVGPADGDPAARWEFPPAGRGGRTLATALLAISLALNLVVVLLVHRGRVSHILTVLWLFSIVYFLLSAGGRPRFSWSRMRPTKKTVLATVVVLLPAVVRIAHMDADRVHGDELMTAYFSTHHDFRHTSFFEPMPDRADWVSQFPKPFFVLQRWFFEVAGKSLAAVWFSTLPYVVLVSALLYRVVRELLGRATAVIAVVLYAFFAPSVYLEVSGFHFISSTAAFLGFFYFAVRSLRAGSPAPAAATGVLAGFCYLFYSSSYIAIPVFVVVALFDLVRRRSLGVVFGNLAIALLGCWIVLSPFLAKPETAGYLFQRSSQVSLLTGEWSGNREAIARGADPLPIIRANLLLALKSMTRDGIGGHGGYDFGRLAFFDPLSLGFLLAGAGAAIFLVRRAPEVLLVFVVIAASFVGGVVLTIPPPAYHRFSLAFPFLVIVMALPFSLLLRARWLSSPIRGAVAAGCMLLFASVNVDRVAQARLGDRFSDDLRLARFIDQRYPARKLYVAAFPSYAFEKLYFFLKKPGIKRRIQTSFHADLLRSFDRREKYVYAFTLPPAFSAQFLAADPAGKLYRFSIGYGLFAN
ncbi:MAG TPA: glycosyltransferase family 39 protein [Thermoanaerobaculia bacterium]|nr:glycosyltransferase family 39 protein [Thermoanaerobaculia bacterium]